MSWVLRACSAVLLVAAIVIGAEAARAESVVEVASGTAPIPLIPRTAVVDPDGSLTPVEALQRLTQPEAEVETAIYSRGYIPDTVWARIVLDVAPAAAGRWYLSLELPNFDRLDVFTVPDGGAPEPFVALGDRVPQPTDIRTRFHIAPIDLGPGRTVLLVRGRTGSTMTIDLKLRKLDELLEQEQAFFGLQTFFIGIAAILGLSALGLFLYTRQVVHLVYVLNLVAHSSVWLLINGTGPGHLWPELAARVHFDSHFVSAVSIFATLSFASIFLSTARVPRLIRGVMWFGAGLGAALALFWLTVPVELSYWSNALVAHLLLPIACLLVIPTGIALFYGEPAARPLMLTWLGFIVVILFGTLRNQGVIPSNTLTLAGGQFGSVFEMVMFAYMLVARLGRVQREKEQLQREALVAAREQEVVLERRVVERTAELDAAVVREREARRLQQQFVAMVSHEFRTPLAIVDASTQNFATQDTGDHSRLDKIRAAIRRLRRMIDTCLVDERVQGGRLHLQLDDVEMCEVVEDTVDMLQAASADHRFALDLPDGPVMVKADLRLIGVVVSNLMENAVKYSPAGTTVGVAVGETPGGIELAVTDQGPGIAEADRERVFDRYVRADTSAGVTGAGLGLYLVRSILAAHGGSVECRAAPGGGCRFVVRMPSAAAAPSAAA